MISGLMPINKHCLPPLFGFLLCLSPVAGAAMDMDELMDSMAAVQTFKAKFTETKHNVLLEHPIEVSGELIYRAPAYLEKRILSPYVEEQVIQGDEVLIRRDKQERSFSLHAVPELKIVVDSLRATLAGDASTLKSNFRLFLSGTKEKWQLKFIPIHEELEEDLREIIIRGSGEVISEFDVSQTGGNLSHMLIKPPE